MKNVADFLSREDKEAFANCLERVVWLESKADDETIVNYCENVMNTGKLSGKYVDLDDDKQLLISYDGNDEIVPYEGGKSNPNRTLKTLAKVIGPDHQLRVWKNADNKDKIAVVPLKTEEWKELENKYGKEKVDEHFSLVDEDSILLEN